MPTITQQGCDARGHGCPTRSPLTAAKPRAERRSRLGLQLVAGVGIEPTTFGL